MRGPAARRSGFRTAPVRALLCLGILLGLAAPVTLAYWTDTVTVAGGDFTSGTLNLQLTGNEGATGAPWQPADFTLDAMLPGESVAKALTIDNVGDTWFTYSATATAVAGATGGDLSPDLRFSIAVGAAATGAARSRTCTGGTSYGPFTLGPGFQTVIPPTPPPPALGPGGKQAICIVASLPSGAPNSAQGKSSRATFRFQADQVPMR